MTSAVGRLAQSVNRLFDAHDERAHAENALKGTASTDVTLYHRINDDLLSMLDRDLNTTPIERVNAPDYANKEQAEALAPYFNIAVESLKGAKGDTKLKQNVDFGENIQPLIPQDSTKVGPTLSLWFERLRDPETSEPVKEEITKALQKMNQRIDAVTLQANVLSQNVDYAAEQAATQFIKTNEQLTKQATNIKTAQDSVNDMKAVLGFAASDAASARKLATAATKTATAAVTQSDALKATIANELIELENALNAKQEAINGLNEALTEQARLTTKDVLAAEAEAVKRANAYADELAAEQAQREKELSANATEQARSMSKNVLAAKAGAVKDAKAYADGLAAEQAQKREDLKTKIDEYNSKRITAQRNINKTIIDVKGRLQSFKGETKEDLQELGDKLEADVKKVSDAVASTDEKLTTVTTKTKELEQAQKQASEIQEEEVKRRQQLDTAVVIMSGLHVLNVSSQLSEKWDALCKDETLTAESLMKGIGPIMLQMAACAGPAVSAALWYSAGIDVTNAEASVLAGVFTAALTGIKLFACRYFRPGLPTLATLRTQVADILDKMDATNPPETTKALVEQLQSTTALLHREETVPSAMLSVSLCKHLMYDPTGDCAYITDLSFKETTAWSVEKFKETFWAKFPVRTQTVYDRKFTDVFIKLCAIQADMCVLMSKSTLKFTPEAYLYMAMGSGFGTTAGRPSFGGRCIQFPATGVGNLSLRESGTCTVSGRYTENVDDSNLVKLLKKSVSTLQNILSRPVLPRDAQRVVKAAVDASAAAAAPRGPRGAGSSADASRGPRGGAPARSSPFFSLESADDYVAAPGTFFMRRYDATAMVPLDDAAETLLRQVIRGRSFTYGDVLRHRTRFGPIMAGLPAVRGLGSAINCVVQVDATHIANDGYPLVAFYDGTSNVPMYLLYRDM